LNTKKVLLLLLIVIIILLSFRLVFRVDRPISPEIPQEILRVHFIDAGQGDATLLEGPDFTILIDAGRHDNEKVIDYLRTLNIQHIDLLIGTHPHADHIGQFPQILGNYHVHEVWMSGDLHTTLTFERALDAILASDARYNEPRAGDSYTLGSSLIEVLNPNTLTGQLNNGSIVIRVIFSNIIFLFMGDAEIPAEEEILNRGHALKADILKVGHHGSRSSTSYRFLEAVDPEIAIYSAGHGNSYGHPHPEVIERLNLFGIDVYGTDTHGSIIISTDGKTYLIETERVALW